MPDPDAPDDRRPDDRSEFRSPGASTPGGYSPGDYRSGDYIPLRRPPVIGRPAVPRPFVAPASAQGPASSTSAGGAAGAVGGGAARPVALAVAALLGVAACGAVLSAAGVRAQPVNALALLFLPAGPGAALAYALPGRSLGLRLLAALFGGLAVDTLLAQAMLSLRIWSPRQGAVGALLVTAGLLAVAWLLTRREHQEGLRPPEPEPDVKGAAGSGSPG